MGIFFEVSNSEIEVDPLRCVIWKQRNAWIEMLMVPFWYDYLTLVCCALRCSIVLFHPRKNRQTHIVNQSRKTVTAVAFSADGKYLVSGECGHQPSVRIWDLNERNQVAEFTGHKFGVVCVVSPLFHSFTHTTFTHHNQYQISWIF